MPTFFACLAAVTALALTPGPDTTLVIRNCVAALHFSVAILYLSGLSLCIDRSREVLEKRWIQSVFHGLCGTVLLFFGIHLLVEE